MSKEILQKVINDGVDGNLNDFFLSVSNFYTEKDDDLAEYNEGRFSNFKGIGEINFEDGQKLVVATTAVACDLTERSGKKEQYEKAKKILKFYTRYDAGIFVFSDANNNIRLSLVYGIPDATRTVWSNFRRFTYYASPNLTNKTFLDRVGNCSFNSLGVIKDAFSVEKVTASFYQKIADWYFWTVQNSTFPADVEQELNGRNNAIIRLITRLIFIWFMKERELVPTDLFKQEKVTALLKSLKPEETTYYKAILQNLFFATLNTRIPDRAFRFKPSYRGMNSDYMDHGIYRYEDYFNNREDMLVIFKDIPFLNGGLFDCLDWSAKESGTGTEVRFDGFSDKDTGLNVPNYLFFGSEYIADLNTEYGTKDKIYHLEGIINTLSAYNFTIDENDPNDQEVALDPELLGKVFENLLASFNPETATTARKATGSYYTPREIVDYIVTQSLKQYYKTYLGDIDGIDSKMDELLAPVTGEATNPFNVQESERIVQLTEGLRIVDPAVGSGAFPMGILNKLVSVLDKADHDNRLWHQAQLRVIENIPDPVSRQRAKEHINFQFSLKNSNYGRKLYLIQRCIYGVDIQPIAIEIAKLRFFIALLVDETIDKSRPNWGIEPLPNMDFKLMQGNSLISEFMGINLDNDDSESHGKLIKDETDELIAEFQKKKNDFQIEPDKTRKAIVRHEVESLILRIFESKLQIQKADYFSNLQKIQQKYGHSLEKPQYKAAFDQEIASIDKRYGFSLVQAEKDLKEFSTGQKVKPFFAWRLYFAEVFHEKGGFDIVIANPPYINAINMTKSIPTQREWIKNNYKFMIEKWDIYLAFIEKGITLLREDGVISYIIPDAFLTEKYSKSIQEYIVNNIRIIRIDYFNNLNIFENVGVNNIIFAFSKSKPELPIEKIEHLDLNGTISMSDINSFSKAFTSYFEQSITREGDAYQKLGDICFISVGIVFNADEKRFKGEFVKEDLISTTPSKIHCRRLIEGEDIFKYQIKDFRYVEWNTARVPDKVRRPTFPELHYPNKLVTNKVGQVRVAFDDTGFVCDQTVRVLVKWDQLKGINNKSISSSIARYSDLSRIALEKIAGSYSYLFLLGLLNSKFVRCYFDRLRGVGSIDINPLKMREIPIPKVSEVQTKPVIALVDTISSIANSTDYFTNSGKQANVRQMQAKIDELVYKLYGLTPKEIELVESEAHNLPKTSIISAVEISSVDEVETDDREENVEEATQVEIILIKERETPGTWRYKEDKSDRPMTIYLTKAQVKELGDPQSIKLTITAA